MKMRVKLKKISFYLLFLLTPFIAQGQNARITGKVIDQNGDELIGVTIMELETENGTITDVDGNFSIVVSSLNSSLKFSYVGYEDFITSINNRTIINVEMEESSSQLDEVVVVGYGTQRRESVTGAISAISSDEVLKAPSMNISNVIGSRVSGISAVQASGQPGANEAALRVRGQGAIYVIDGIRRTTADFNGLDPNEIASISILKDASSTAVYGLDANSAIIVTTKKGKNQKTSITYTGNYGISVNADEQVWLDGPGYAYWYNKAREMDGDPIVFSDEVVQKMRDGVDGWGNTNWYKEMYGTGIKQHHNITSTGGNDKINFFVSLGYFDEKGNLENFDYNRYNLRSNIESQLSESLHISLGISGRIEERDRPYFAADPDTWLNIPQQIVYAVPYIPTTMEKDGQTYYTSGSTSVSHVSPIGAVRESGYNYNKRTYLQSNLALEYTPKWLEGFRLRFQGAYDITHQKNKRLKIPYRTLIASRPNINTTAITYSEGIAAGNNNITLSESYNENYYITTQTSANYDKSWNKHTINLLALLETRETGASSMSASGAGLDFIHLDELNNITNQTGDGELSMPSIGGTSSQTKLAGFVGRVNYDYAHKYLLEASLRHDGSYLFGGMNQRWVTIPAISAGWRINNEDWFKAEWVDDMKLRAGFGKTATSGINPFLWQNTMSVNQNTVVIGGNSQSTITPSVLGNPNLTWAQAKNYNAGVDATMWRGLLGVEFDVFYIHSYDRLGSVSGAYPPSIGGYYFNTANINETDYKGMDLTLKHNNRVDQFRYGVRLVWSYAYGRWLKYSGDAENTPDYRKLTGKQIGAKVGFLADGLFQDEDEIKNSATREQSPVRPGDIKYVDRNGDGEITFEQDMGYVGRSSTPTHTGSMNFYGGWKGFDFDLLFSWGLGHDIALSGVYTSAGSEGVQSHTAFTRHFYQGGNSLAYLMENSWVPGKTDAEFPRLAITTTSNNNAYASTFFYRKGDFLRFKMMQVGYTFPRNMVEPLGVSALRIYVDGYNLFTWSGLSKYNIDPEAPAVNNGYYPQQRTFSVGVKLTF